MSYGGPSPHYSKPMECADCGGLRTPEERTAAALAAGLAALLESDTGAPLENLRDVHELLLHAFRPGDVDLRIGIVDWILDLEAPAIAGYFDGMAEAMACRCAR